MFPGGHPSKYSQGSMLLNFSDQTRTGAFSMIWPLADKSSIERPSYTHIQHFSRGKCIHIQHLSGGKCILSQDTFYIKKHLAIFLIYSYTTSFTRKMHSVARHFLYPITLSHFLDQSNLSTDTFFIQ